MENIHKEFEERVIETKRVTKKTTGGSSMSFSVLAVVGDRNGKVGYGHSKGRDVSSAIQKAVALAKRNVISIKRKGGTIAHEVSKKSGAAEIYLKPAPEGAGLIAGGAVRQVLELAGVRDISAKMFGSSNKLLNVHATIEALKSLKG